MNIYLVERAGFEPAKAEPADLQSAPFSHSGTSPSNGAGDGTRTRNLLITSQLLYQLSYTSALVTKYIISSLFGFVNTFFEILDVGCDLHRVSYIAPPTLRKYNITCRQGQYVFRSLYLANCGTYIKLDHSQGTYPRKLLCGFFGAGIN
jgi:hypothetical protein